MTPWLSKARLDVPTGTERVYAEIPPQIVYRRSFTLSRELDGTMVRALPLVGDRHVFSIEQPAALTSLLRTWTPHASG